MTIDGYSQQGSSPNTATTGTNAVLKIVLEGSHADPSANELVVAAPDSTVKGLVIDGFSEVALEVPPSRTGSTLEGCFVGTDVTGTAASPNTFAGVFVDGAKNTIGGVTPAARNLITGNGQYGVLLLEAKGTKIQGNLIGTKKDGTSALGNGADGIQVDGGSGNIIGGSAEAANTIAFNGRDGVSVTSNGIGNRILGNSIFSNGSAIGDLGIDLGGDGVTANDPKDSDTGPNNLQNFPEISSAVASGDSTTIGGSLNSTPEKAFTVQFFSSPVADPSGSGEGETFLGQKKVKTNKQGNDSFTFTASQDLSGQFITATVTGPGGNTSEFSKAVTAS